MPRPSYAIGLEAEGTLLQDRVRVIEVEDGLVIAVADGAGGVSGSERAAEAVIQEIGVVVESGVSLDSETTWTDLLTDLDAVIHRAGSWGLTTAIVLAATDRWICGASVGDSEAWLASTEDFHSLTSYQTRKPMIGSGAARPVSFSRKHFGGTLIVGTDGLFKYAPSWKICQIAASSPVDLASRTVLDLVRLPNGRLQDDIGFVLSRFADSDDVIDRT